MRATAPPHRLSSRRPRSRRRCSPRRPMIRTMPRSLPSMRRRLRCHRSSHHRPTVTHTLTALISREPPRLRSLDELVTEHVRDDLGRICSWPNGEYATVFDLLTIEGMDRRRRFPHIQPHWQVCPRATGMSDRHRCSSIISKAIRHVQRWDPAYRDQYLVVIAPGQRTRIRDRGARMSTRCSSTGAGKPLN